jgi:hypothetical protein
MALLTDGAISTLDDLRALDSAVLETATVESIDVSRKLTVAAEAIQLELAVFLIRASGQSGSRGGPAELSRVVVTPGLRRWHTLRTLAEIYSDAYNSHFNDRYSGKYRHFLKLTRETSDLLLEYGVGLVDRPVPRAPMPVVSSAGGGGSVTAYYVRTAWRSADGGSGSPSEMATFHAGGGELISVDAGPAPAGVTAFDVYVGTSEASLARQNASPVAAGSVWNMPLSGAVEGPGPGQGQSPEYYIRRSRTI